MSKKPHNLYQFFSGECKFKIGAVNFDQIPETRLPEVAFIGRSNVGKSSLINALVNQKIALTSKTPGRTRQLNFFCIADRLNLVDMPGFGYAKVSKTDISSWEKLIYQYFANRANLKRAFLLIDSRRGFVEKDMEMVNIFNAVGVSYQLVLTKIDELKSGELEKVMREITKKSTSFAAQHPVILATSSNKNTGVDELKKAIVEVM
ncbi:MAG: GTP-binding protein [Rickettsiales bacterium]|jgi:GTP-binding protein